jgi:hypothetical protein
MRNSPPLRRAGNIVRVGAGGVTAVALCAAIVSAQVLLRRFRPDLQVDDLQAVIEVGPRYAPRGWVAVHEVALNAAVLGSIVWAAATAALVRARSGAATALMLVATGIAVIGCVAASLTWGLVRWDQIALWTVMSGEFFAAGGLWRPAVSDDVRFLIIGGAEVGQDAYRRALIVHLAAPIVAVVALGTSSWLGRRSQPLGTVGP